MQITPMDPALIPTDYVPLKQAVRDHLFGGDGSKWNLIGTATHASMRAALVEGDPSLLMTKAGEPVFTNGATKLDVKLPAEVRQRPTQPAAGGDALAHMVAGAILPIIREELDAKVDEDAVRQLVQDELSRADIRTLRVEFRGQVNQLDGIIHPLQEDLILTLGCRSNVALTGPAGSGKTTAAGMAARALGLPFHPYAMGPQTGKTDALGYTSAHGAYVPGFLYDWYVNGGVLLLDEFDACNPAAAVVINAALAGETGDLLMFPCGPCHKHETAVAVAAMNTKGQGADRRYAGRQQQDAATMDRFARMIEWGYDLKLERARSMAFAQTDAHRAAITAYVDRVQAIRAAADCLNMDRIVLSPRASIEGSKHIVMLWGQRDAAWVEAGTIWAKFSKDDAAKLQGALAA